MLLSSNQNTAGRQIVSFKKRKPVYLFTSKMALTMTKENELLQQEIMKLQDKLRSLVTGPQTLEPDISQGDEDTTVLLRPQILRQKCKQLRSRIDVVESSKYNVLPNDDNIQYEILKKDFITRISQTKECLKFQEHQRKEMHGNIEREKKINDELSSIVSAAGSKYREIQTDKTSKKLVCERLQSKCTQLEKINSELKKETSNFISKNFPLPDKQLFNSVKKKMEISHQGIELMNYGSLLSLTEIVELLMNANADTPNDPYIVLDHRYWPPYIELLLECDVVVRHPADTRRIKLLPFHL